MHRVLIAAVAVVSSGACSTDDEPAAATDAPAGRCIVRLHGKGGSGGDDAVAAGGVLDISPAGNADGWGGRQWLYFPDEEFENARRIIADAAEPCAEVIVNGFSNGGSMAAKLYCRGEDLGGRLVRVVVDDPVPDHGINGCDPVPGIDVTLYWTGALAETATPGWDCGEADWTCEGGTTVGVDAYADELGTEVLQSVHDEHTWYWDAPELSRWGD